MDPSEQRIGDAERDAAVEALRDHHVAGRLTPEEFDERMSAALAARTRGDLEPLFADLPDDRPARASLAKAPTAKEVAPADGGNRYHRVVEVLSAIAWPAALIINFATGWQWWWIIFIPIFLVPALVGEDRGHRARQRRQMREDRPRQIGTGGEGDQDDDPPSR